MTSRGPRLGHQLKFGGSWALYKKIQDVFGQTQGSFTFNGSYTGNDFADFLLGYANQYQEAALQDKAFGTTNPGAVYAQDNWKVNRRLTLTLGLRWDGIPHTYEENNRQSISIPICMTRRSALCSSEAPSAPPARDSVPAPTPTSPARCSI